MGCVLFVTTLGLRPFGRGTHAVMSKIVQGDFKAPRELVPTYPERLERIVVRALSRNPDDRFQTAEEMRLALEEWLAKSGKIVTHTDIARAVNERLNPKVRDQIQALRTANRFTPQTAIADREEGEDAEDSWELPTAVSGLIQLPDDIAREAAPSAVRPQPGPVPTIDLSGNDTQPSIAPRARLDASAMRDSTKISNDVRAVREELAHQSTPKLPARARVADSIGVISGTRQQRRPVSTSGGGKFCWPRWWSCSSSCRSLRAGSSLKKAGARPLRRHAPLAEASADSTATAGANPCWTRKARAALSPSAIVSRMRPRSRVMRDAGKARSGRITCTRPSGFQGLEAGDGSVIGLPTVGQRGPQGRKLRVIVTEEAAHAGWPLAIATRACGDDDDACRRELQRRLERNGIGDPAIDVGHAVHRHDPPIDDGQRHGGLEQLVDVVPVRRDVVGRPRDAVGHGDAQGRRGQLHPRCVERQLASKDLHQPLDVHQASPAQQVASRDQLGAVGSLAPDSRGPGQSGRRPCKQRMRRPRTSRRRG